MSGGSSVSAASVHHNQYPFRAASNNHESGRRTDATRTINCCQWECERAQSPPKGSWSRSASRSVSRSASGECARGAGAGAYHTSASALRPRSNPTHSALADTPPTWFRLLRGQAPGESAPRPMAAACSPPEHDRSGSDRKSISIFFMRVHADDAPPSFNTYHSFEHAPSFFLAMLRSASSTPALESIRITPAL